MNKMKWIRFYKLNHGEEFFLASRRYIKTDIFKAFAVLDGKRICVLPWRKVRSTRPFGKAPINRNFDLGFVATPLRVIPPGVRTEPVE